MKNLTTFDILNIRLALTYSIKAWEKMIDEAKQSGNEARVIEYTSFLTRERETLAKIEGRF